MCVSICCGCVPFVVQTSRSVFIGSVCHWLDQGTVPRCPVINMGDYGYCCSMVEFLDSSFVSRRAPRGVPAWGTFPMCVVLLMC